MLHGVIQFLTSQKEGPKLDSWWHGALLCGAFMLSLCWCRIPEGDPVTAFNINLNHTDKFPDRHTEIQLNWYKWSNLEIIGGLEKTQVAQYYGLHQKVLMETSWVRCHNKSNQPKQLDFLVLNGLCHVFFFFFFLVVEQKLFCSPSAYCKKNANAKQKSPTYILLGTFLVFSRRTNHSSI